MWSVTVSRRVARQIAGLPEAVRKRLQVLLAEIELFGPVRGNWPHYSVLTGSRHHCHLKGGRPTYVAVWQAEDKSIRLAELIYVGTHGKAPY